MRTTPLALLTLFALAVAPHAGAKPPAPTLDAIAQSYVKLVLAIGQHDADYVDSYYGPPEWRTEAVARGKRPLPELAAEAKSLHAALARAKVKRNGDAALRRDYLDGQLVAVAAEIDRLGGKKLAFDDEAEVFYQLRPAHHATAEFDAALAELDALVPGPGTVQDRYQSYRKRFIVPGPKVDAVFQAAIAEARKRTQARIALPAGERFTVEYVKGKSWSGYNWYQGDSRSLIQVNLDLPIYIDRALDLAAHEGYPGHHVYNALLEQHLARPAPTGRGWVEFSVYPLFSPQSLIAEGSANFGIEVAFPGEERTRFERDVLFPLAGFDGAEAARYAAVRAITKRLAFAGNEAAREYLDGRIDRAAAEAWLVRYALMTPAAAAQRVRFMDQYRSYVINYNAGEALVRDWVERTLSKEGGTTPDPARRWALFAELISSPRLPKALQAR
jgi:hypothetical protein